VPVEVNAGPDLSGAVQTSVAQLQTLLHLPEDCDGGAYFRFFEGIRRDWVNKNVRRDLLRQFLRFTSTDTLHMTKWRIESCSRLLLAKMIGIANLRRPLIQAEVPINHEEEKNNRQEQYILVGANEGQLRGYVMLLAAKLPLIEGVQLYLQNNHDKLEELAGRADSDAARPFWEPINGLWRSWDSLLKSIRDSIAGLEQALEQANMDEMLAETQALRDEEETRAEIERIQERSAGGLTPNSNRTVSVVANVVAAASVLIVVANFGLQLPKLRLSNVPTELQPWRYIPSYLAPLTDVLAAILILGVAAAALVVIILVLAVVYLLAQAATAPVLRWIFHLAGRLENRRRKREEQYYYEMDLDLPADMSETRALQLFEGDFRQETSNCMPVTKEDKYLPRVEARRGFRPERTSYHINRTSRGAAQHKVYIAATVCWPRSGRRLMLAWWLPKDRMRIYVVYEVLFHTRSNKPTYRLEKIRVVSTTDETVTPVRLDQLKHLVVNVFVNPWLESPLDMVIGKKVNDDDPQIDAFFSMTAASGQADGARTRGRAPALTKYEEAPAKVPTPAAV
jgi:hypothetical protein